MQSEVNYMIQAQGEQAVVIGCAELSEAELMEATLRRLRRKGAPRHISPEATRAIAEERVGEEFSTRPFLY